MRIVTYGAACSLDGFIAAADGSLDWLHFSRDVQEAMAGYLATVDTILMGRKTWEAGLAMGQGPMPGARTYVFSRTLREPPHPEVELVGSDPGEFVRELKGRPGGGICVMGGGELARALLEAGVVDQVGVNVHPVLLGSGVPLFRDAGRRIRLRLVENRTLQGGCVYATYRVADAG